MVMSCAPVEVGVPLWIEQIKAGKPITITDPNMTRFIMTLDEAVDLVLFAL
jgi:UDP-N-acetylglucosamine 4,6-dehydratase